VACLLVASWLRRCHDSELAMVGATSAQACDGTFSSHAIILAGPIHIGTVCWTRSAASSSMYKSGFQGTSALRRRQRALQRGYLVPRCSDGYRYMSIRGDLRQRIKATHASLKLHVAHQDTVGAKFHVARHAIEAARPTAGHVRATSAYAAHRQANRAEHEFKAKPSTTSTARPIPSASTSS